MSTYLNCQTQILAPRLVKILAFLLAKYCKLTKEGQWKKVLIKELALVQKGIVADFEEQHLAAI